MLQDIKKLEACQTAKILAAFLILHKKNQLLIFVTKLTQTDYVIISLLNTAIEKKKNKAWKTECQKTDEWLHILWEAINTDPGVSRTFSRIFFLNKTTQNTLVMLYRKLLRKKNNYQMFCLNL